MDAQEAVQKYPGLAGLYIPVSGEIIEWGKGSAIVLTSPLDTEGSPLVVISLNSNLFDPFEVDGSMLMGPYRAVIPENQAIRVLNLNALFDDRFTKMCREHPEAALAWRKYKKEKGV